MSKTSYQATEILSSWAFLQVKTPTSQSQAGSILSFSILTDDTSPKDFSCLSLLSRLPVTVTLSPLLAQTDFEVAQKL